MTKSEGSLAIDAPYMPQLDALRALAVLGVMAHHFAPRSSAYIPLGMGVRLFFVLSGFLITGILLRCRRPLAASGLGAAVTLRQFYIRRVLRIVPIYYLTLCLLFIIGISEVRRSIGWHLAFLSNTRFAALKHADPYTGHLWTLSVEEQFYLVWPAVVLLLPRRWAVTVACVGLLAGPAYRYRAIALDWQRDTASYLTLANVDVLAAGALLAMFWATGSKEKCSEQIHRYVRWAGLALGVVPLVILLAFRASSRIHHYDRPGLYFVMLNTAMAFAFAWIIDACAVGVGGWLGRLLNWRPLLYLGKISYGTYILHNLMPPLISWIAGRLQFVAPPEGIGSFFICTTATIAAAAVSWHWLERPINSLKRYFPYMPNFAVDPFNACLTQTPQ